MGSFVKGFLLGALVGATAALLLSPGKGLENRSLVRQRIQEAREAALEASRKRAEELRARYRQAVGTPEEE